jgi:hypothetical protein
MTAAINCYCMQGLLDFPLAVLARVLEHVPTQQRLSQCALVCQHFAAAAAIATNSISICNRRRCYGSSCTGRHRLPDSKLPALQAWTQQHAGQLVSISFCGKHQLQLPCADLLQLTSLELAGQMLLLQDSVNMHAADSTSTGAAGMLLRSGRTKSVTGPARQRPASAEGQRSNTVMQQLLPKLQRLELSECKLGGEQQLQQLSTLTSLTSLKLGSMTLAGPTAQPINAQQAEQQEQALSIALSTLLPHLKRLVELRLGVHLAGTGLGRVTLQLGRLPQLRSVHVSIPDGAAPTDKLMAYLPSGLTRLSVWDSRRGPDTFDLFMGGMAPPVPIASLPRQLPQLSTLQELELGGAVLYPSLLSDMPHLRRLEVNPRKLLPGGDAAADRTAAGALLAACGGLQHLTQLHIWCNPIDIDCDQNLNAGDPAAYTALTASTALHSLTYAGKRDLLVASDNMRTISLVECLQVCKHRGCICSMHAGNSTSQLCFPNIQITMSVTVTTCVTWEVLCVHILGPCNPTNLG